MTNIENGSPSMVQAKYSVTRNTTGNVIVTISSEKAIENIPEGWISANSYKTVISKTFEQNTIETIEIKDISNND